MKREEGEPSAPTELSPLLSASTTGASPENRRRLLLTRPRRYDESHQDVNDTPHQGLRDVGTGTEPSDLVDDDEDEWSPVIANVDLPSHFNLCGIPWCQVPVPSWCVVSWERLGL